MNDENGEVFAAADEEDEEDEEWFDMVQLTQRKKNMR
jgi:hypothetical protein